MVGPLVTHRVAKRNSHEVHTTRQPGEAHNQRNRWSQPNKQISHKQMIITRQQSQHHHQTAIAQHHHPPRRGTPPDKQMATSRQTEMTTTAADRPGSKARQRRMAPARSAEVRAVPGAKSVGSIGRAAMSVRRAESVAHRLPLSVSAITRPKQNMSPAATACARVPIECFRVNTGSFRAPRPSSPTLTGLQTLTFESAHSQTHCRSTQHTSSTPPSPIPHGKCQRPYRLPHVNFGGSVARRKGGVGQRSTGEAKVAKLGHHRRRGGQKDIVWLRGGGGRERREARSRRGAKGERGKTPYPQTHTHTNTHKHKEKSTTEIPSLRALMSRWTMALVSWM